MKSIDPNPVLQASRRKLLLIFRLFSHSHRVILQQIFLLKKTLHMPSSLCYLLFISKKEIKINKMIDAGVQ
jgi:hypothetical protein